MYFIQTKSSRDPDVTVLEDGWMMRMDDEGRTGKEREGEGRGTEREGQGGMERDEEGRTGKVI